MKSSSPSCEDARRQNRSRWGRGPGKATLVLLTTAALHGATSSSIAGLTDWQNLITSKGDPAATVFTPVSGASPMMVDVGALTGERSFEFIVNAGVGGESSALLGSLDVNGNQGLKFEQYPDQLVYGLTTFGQSDYLSPIPSSAGLKTHVVYVSDGSSGTDLYVNGVRFHTFPVPLELAGMQGLAAIANPPGAAVPFIDILDGNILGFASFDWALDALTVVNHYKAYANDSATSCVPNDNFADATLIEGIAGTVIGLSDGATMEPDEPLIMEGFGDWGDFGGQSVWWKWIAPVTGRFTIDTRGTSFDTSFAIYVGTGMHDIELAEPGPWSSENVGLQSELSIDVLAGTLYHIKVDGQSGDSGRVMLNWGCVPTNDDFSGAARIEGSSGSFHAVTYGATSESADPEVGGPGAGGATVWYRWRAPRNGKVYFSAHGLNYVSTLLGVYTGTAGSLATIAKVDGFLESLVQFQAVAGTDYHIMLQAASTDEHGKLRLNWSMEPPPNNAFAAPTVLSGPEGTSHAQSYGATLETGEPKISNRTGGSSVWWKWIAPESGPVTVSTYTSTIHAMLGVYRGTAVNMLQTVTEDTGEDAFNQGTSVRFDAVAGTEYHIKADGYTGEPGYLVLNWFQSGGAVPPNDNFAARISLTRPSGSVVVDNTGATREAGEPHLGSDGERSVWWTWTAPSSGLYEFHTRGSATDTTLGVFTGDSLVSLKLVTINEDEDYDNWSSAVGFCASAGTVYQIVADGCCGGSGIISLSWSPFPAGSPAFRASLRLEGPNTILEWAGAKQPYKVQHSTDLRTWTDSLTNVLPPVFLPPGQSSDLFRVVGD